MLRDLRAAEAFVEAIERTAPEAVAAAGGGYAIQAAAPGHVVAGNFWSADMAGQEETWAAMAYEHQAPYR